MAKREEQKLARHMYINEMLNKAQIAKRLKINERTVTRWISANKWDDILVAKVSGLEFQANDLRTTIAEMVRKRLDMEHNAKSTGADKSKITDEISKLSKALENLENKGKPALAVIVHIIEQFMNALKQYDIELYQKTMDFHINWLKQMAETHR